MITLLSYPSDRMINDFIDPHLCTVQYASFNGVVDICMIANLRRGTLIGKMDVESAFCLIPIYPGDFDLLGFSLDGLYYIDKCLPMIRIRRVFLWSLIKLREFCALKQV